MRSLYLFAILFVFLVGCSSNPSVSDTDQTDSSPLTGHTLIEAAVTPDHVLHLQTITKTSTFSDAEISRLGFVPQYVLVDVGAVVQFVHDGTETEPVRLVRRDGERKVTDVYKGELRSDKPLYFRATKAGAKYQLLCIKTECSASIEVKP